MTDKILEAWSEDIDVRVNGLERETRASLGVDVHEIVPGVIYDRDGVRVTAFAVPHTIWRSAFGYRFDTPGKSITFSGDTAVNEDLVRVAKGTDILVHEVYDSKRAHPENRPGGEFWPQYLRAAHTSDVDVGRLALEIKPKLLVLDHVVLGGGTFDEVLEGVRAGGYTGKVVVGKDLDRY
jgi:ribonuclease Z